LNILIIADTVVELTKWQEFVNWVEAWSGTIGIILTIIVAIAGGIIASIMNKKSEERSRKTRIIQQRVVRLDEIYKNIIEQFEKCLSILSSFFVKRGSSSIREVKKAEYWEAEQNLEKAYSHNEFYYSKSARIRIVILIRILKMVEFIVVQYDSGLVKLIDEKNGDNAESHYYNIQNLLIRLRVLFLSGLEKLLHGDLSRYDLFESDEDFSHAKGFCAWIFEESYHEQNDIKIWETIRLYEVMSSKESEYYEGQIENMINKCSYEAHMLLSKEEKPKYPRFDVSYDDGVSSAKKDLY